MTALKRERVGNEVERPEAERMSADDAAAARAQELVHDALHEHRLRQERAARHHRPGLCSNCGEACEGLEVYCDVDCRFDHERRLAASARAGS